MNNSYTIKILTKDIVYNPRVIQNLWSTDTQQIMRVQLLDTCRVWHQHDTDTYNYSEFVFFQIINGIYVSISVSCSMSISILHSSKSMIDQTPSRNTLQTHFNHYTQKKHYSKAMVHNKCVDVCCPQHYSYTFSLQFPLKLILILYRTFPNTTLQFHSTHYSYL
jgi:hypothetical protein